jgi:hypothetical protein
MMSFFDLHDHVKSIITKQLLNDKTVDKEFMAEPVDDQKYYFVK